jgi:hypothetical protein
MEMMMTKEEQQARTARSYKLILLFHGGHDHDVAGLISAL